MDVALHLLDEYGGTAGFEASVQLVRDLYHEAAIRLFHKVIRHDSRRVRLQENLISTADGYEMAGRVDFLISGPDRDAVLDDADADRAGSLIVPVMWGVKGSLYSNLLVTDTAGARLPLLPQVQVTALVGLALEDLLRQSLTLTEDTALTPEQRQVLHRLGALVSIPDPVAVPRFRAAFTAIVAALGLPDAALAEIRGLVEYFAEGYVLAVEAPAGVAAHLGVDYHYASPPEPTPSSSFNVVPTRIYGLTSPNRRVNLTAAATLFHSYHLVLEGRAGSYASTTRLHRIGADDRLHPVRPPGQLAGKPRPGRAGRGPDPGGSVADEVVIAHRVRRFGDSSVHLHINQPPDARPPLAWQVRYAEIPPGSLLPLATMALANFLVGSVLAFSLPRVDNPIDYNAPTLTLAIPLFALTVFGFTFNNVRASLGGANSYLSGAVLTVANTLFAVLGQPVTAGSDTAFLGGAFGVVHGHRVYAPLLVSSALSLGLMAVVAALLITNIRCYARIQKSG